MQLSHHPPAQAKAPVTPLVRPQQGRAPASWPFYVQAPRPLSRDIKVNAARVLETAARYFFSAPKA
ncbi:hypothetical protein SAMN05216350_102330 [Polaromonas sp. YR568]|uniref:hypothetical protein n=1 Tax=Polaromonas sp. YR568 TaxID=1855301 RepID=UPI0008E21618|nr:hypothetical protein [Polaromonas sp. YR568]SFU51878.1 hypothetical protein SAMN05216350_102330 [Polaromonas sp. YR568]